MIHLPKYKTLSLDGTRAEPDISVRWSHQDLGTALKSQKTETYNLLLTKHDYRGYSPLN